MWRARVACLVECAAADEDPVDLQLLGLGLGGGAEVLGDRVDEARGGLLLLRQERGKHLELAGQNVTAGARMWRKVGSLRM